MTTATVKADSVSPFGHRLTTLELCMPRFLLAQFNTHRAFSRNAQSSRAVPAKRLIGDVESRPFRPAFAANRPGMSAGEPLDEAARKEADAEWEIAARTALMSAKRLADLGVHKQWVNRLLEPFSRVKVLVTSTEWDNFFRQRLHHAAQPEMQELASRMKEALDASSPTALSVGGWHVPFGEKMHAGLDLLERIMVATARCARLSYASHDGEFSLVRDLELHGQLLGDGHMSPLEHCARCQEADTMFANFRGWASYRWLHENGQLSQLLPWDAWVQANMG